MNGPESGDTGWRERGRRLLVYVGWAVLVWALAVGAYLQSSDSFWLSLTLLAVAMSCLTISFVSYCRLRVRCGRKEANRSANMKPMVFAFALMILVSGILIGQSEDSAPTWERGIWLFIAIYLGALILPLARWKEWVTGEYFRRADEHDKKDS